jgi:enamine deaminase RidA (YjgF/YER057c/UK114 family)
MPVDVRTVESPESAEIYITATPPPGIPVHRQAEDLFPKIKHVLEMTGARLLEERIFAADEAFAAIEPIRAGAYGNLADGIPPSRLAVPKGLVGEIAGVQIHAVRSSQPPKPLRLGESACGRVLHSSGGEYISLSGLSAPDVGPDPTAQARAVFERAETALKQVGTDMRAVARTWVWLDDIVAWYPDFNRVRTRFFIERGLMDRRSESHRPPASTGIGVSLSGGPRIGLDLVAIPAERDSMRHYPAAGSQGSPYEYGSAFSRATIAMTPAGKTVFVSGTAAIDARGATQHVGDPEAQINETIEHVRAVLRDMNCADQDVVQAIAYSKAIAVERLVRATWKQIAWPCLSVLADICREELLFEIEVTACPGARDLPVSEAAPTEERV